MLDIKDIIGNWLVYIFMVIALPLIYWIFYRKPKSDLSTAIPNWVLKKSHRLYTKNRSAVELRTAMVPPDLRHLIPLAEKWGIGDDIIRNNLINKATEKDRRELHDALVEPFERITEWISSLERPSAEAEAFKSMQAAFNKMGFHILKEK